MMKSGAMILAALAALFGDVTPKSGSFSPRRLVEVRSFAAPGLWLVAPGGKYIATSEAGDAFGLIETATGEKLAKFGDHNNAGRHDGNWGQSDRILATTGSDGSVRVWDASSKKMIRELRPHAGYT